MDEVRQDAERDIAAHERGSGLLGRLLRRRYVWPSWLCWLRGGHVWSIDHVLNWPRYRGDFSIKATWTRCGRCGRRA